MPERRTPENVFLKPGELFAGEEPVLISTVLGSCIAVTMFAPKQSDAAICHAMLPDSKGGTRNNPNQPYKFVDHAIEKMVRYFSNRDISFDDVEVKLFGGADMFDSRHGSKTIGHLNIKMAQSLLERQKISIDKQDVGGNRGRKIIFDTRNGAVYLKRVQKTEINLNG